MAEQSFFDAKAASLWANAQREIHHGIMAAIVNHQ